MKKLKLKALGLGAKEILTREQLKYVLGGDGSGSGTGGGGGNTGGGSGGTCCAHSADWISYVKCGVTQATAIAYADQYASTSGNPGYWCCDSCDPQ
jgi:hypothetical protein